MNLERKPAIPCAVCRNPVLPNAVFCRHCGTSIPEARRDRLSPVAALAIAAVPLAGLVLAFLVPFNALHASLVALSAVCLCAGSVLLGLPAFSRRRPHSSRAKLLRALETVRTEPPWRPGRSGRHGPGR